MAGITDQAYRIWMRQLGAEVVTTELVSSEAFIHGSRRTKEMLELVEAESPCGVQIFGHQPDSLLATAKYAESKGAAFIDLNFGCPVEKVTKSGAGAAMMKNLPLMKEILLMLKAHLNIPLSIKIRSGWQSGCINAHEVCKLAQSTNINWLAIHARTRDQKYNGHSDWNLIRELHRQFSIPIIGNGDIKSAHEAKHKLEHRYSSAVMIARAALVNPLIFRQWHQPDFTMPIHHLIGTLIPCIEKYTHPKVQSIHLKKIIAWLSTGFANHTTFKKRLMLEAHTISNIASLSYTFFSKNDTPQQPEQLDFLKGGHG